MPGPLAYAKGLLVGRPKETAGLEHERLSKPIALAVFASDNLSSSAYATEEMLLVLIAAGTGALVWSIPITLTITAVLGLIAFSYRETIHAYPQGGGAYNVAYDNLGRFPGLVAGSALLIDYILTVAVSISAGVDAVVSAAPSLDGIRVPIALGVIAVITIMNLRGAKESGRIFAVPTYAFIVLLSATLAWGFIRYFIFGYRAPGHGLIEATEPFTLLLLMRAFSHGSAAVTGIEAISNGVPAFRKPEARNAASTLAVMAVILGFLFIGITMLARLFHIAGPSHEPRRTVVALIALAVFGNGFLFFAVQTATALILFLAANTSYADFPRLSAALAKDRFAPRQLLNRGDRLAYSNGIIGLAILAAVLVALFNAEVSRLINLYVVGVFLSLTLSQFGMVKHWRDLKGRERRWRRNLVINGVGGTATTIVLGIVLVTKFLEGAWMVVLAIPVLVWTLNRIHRHYAAVGRELRRPERRPAGPAKNYAIVLVGRPSEEELRAFAYAQYIGPEDLWCVHFAAPGERAGVEAAWARRLGGVLTGPSVDVIRAEDDNISKELGAYLDRVRRHIGPDDFITVVVSERVTPGPSGAFGTTKALQIKTSLLFRPGVVVTDVPYLENRPQAALTLGSSLRDVVIVLVSGVHNATLQAVRYARSLQPQELRAVHVSLDPEETSRVVQEWEDWMPQAPLEVVASPFRRLNEPLRDYVRALTASGDTVVTLVLPEFVVERWWQQLLHNQNALSIKWTFLREPNVIVTSVPFHLG